MDMKGYEGFSVVEQSEHSRVLLDSGCSLMESRTYLRFCILKRKGQNTIFTIILWTSSMDLVRCSSQRWHRHRSLFLKLDLKSSDKLNINQLHKQSKEYILKKALEVFIEVFSQLYLEIFLGAVHNIQFTSRW